MCLLACDDPRAPLVDKSLATDPQCDVSAGGCRVLSDDLDLILRFGPEIRALKPFDIEFQFDRSVQQVQEILVRFVMSGMSMGLNEYQLIENEAGLWTGRVTLPVCTSGRSDWLAEITIESDRTRWTLIQPFVVGPP